MAIKLPRNGPLRPSTTNDIPIPTWFVGNTSESLIAYWKDVNDCLPTADPDSDYGQVYWQDKANS